MRVHIYNGKQNATNNNIIYKISINMSRDAGIQGHIAADFNILKKKIDIDF